MKIRKEKVSVITFYTSQQGQMTNNTSTLRHIILIMVFGYTSMFQPVLHRETLFNFRDFLFAFVFSGEWGCVW